MDIQIEKKGDAYKIIFRGRVILSTKHAPDAISFLMGLTKPGPLTPKEGYRITSK